VLTRAVFLEGYAEFRSADNSLIDAKLAEAAACVGEEYGDHANEAHGLITARKLALSPWGVNAKLVSKEGKTVYDAPLLELQATCACGIRIFPKGVTCL